MKMSLIAPILAFSFLSISMAEEPRVENGRPEPPDGYRWQELEGAAGFVLVPNKWHYSTQSTKDSVAFQVTKEDPKVGQFLTGMTINVVRDVKKKTKLDPSLYAVHYLNEYMKGNKVVIKPDKIYDVGPFKRVSCQVEKAFDFAATKRECRVRVVGYANDETGTLFIVIFGAPVEEWDEAWTTGKQLFSPLALNDKI
jgi:hypothetical protein